MMVDIQTASITVASASVVAGVIYYALQIRHQNRVANRPDYEVVSTPRK